MADRPSRKIFHLMLYVLPSMAGIVFMTAISGFSRSVSYHMIWILA